MRILERLAEFVLFGVLNRIFDKAPREDKTESMKQLDRELEADIRKLKKRGEHVGDSGKAGPGSGA